MSNRNSTIHYLVPHHDRRTPHMTTTTDRTWIIEVTHRVLRDGEWRTMPPGYWYGPGHGFGTTSGPLADQRGKVPDYSIATFRTRKAAEDAVRSVYGRLKSNMRAVRLDRIER